MKVVIEIPEKVFWKLAAAAESFEMKVHEYVGELAMNASTKREAEVDPVTVRWRRGLTDKQIAAELNMTNLAVASRRQAYGFPANKRARPTERETA